MKDSRGQTPGQFTGYPQPRVFTCRCCGKSYTYDWDRPPKTCDICGGDQVNHYRRKKAATTAYEEMVELGFEQTRIV